MLHLTQAQLAEKLRLRGQTIWNWENGRAVPPLTVVDNLYLLCSTLQIPAPDFYRPPMGEEEIKLDEAICDFFGAAQLDNPEHHKTHH